MILTFKLPFTNLLAAETFIDVSVVINLILLIATDYVDRNYRENIYVFLNTILVIHSLEMVFAALWYILLSIASNSFCFTECCPSNELQEVFLRAF